MRHKWSKEIIVQKIQDLHNSGKKVSSWNTQFHRPLLYSAAIKYFGSWKAAIKASGLDYDKIRLQAPFRFWGKRKIVRAIRSRVRRGLPVNGLAVYSQDRGLYQAAKRHFGRGGWKKALRFAGIDPKSLDPRRIWTKEKVLKEIRQRARSGLPLYINHLNTTGHSSLTHEGRMFFGSWSKAIQAAGLDYEKVKAIKMRWWNRARVLKGIHQLEIAKVSLNSIFVQRYYGDLFGAARKIFGTWGRAVETAGIDYRQHLKIWTYKSWLQRLKPAEIRKLEKQTIEFAKKRKMN